MRTATRPATAVLLVALALVGAACGGSGAATSSASGPSDGATTDPDRLVITQIDESGDLVSINPLGNHVPLPMQFVYDTLVRLDPAEDAVVPRLAESMERVDDLTWEVVLRDDVTYHDGSTFDAQDVAATVEYILEEDNGSGLRRFIASIVEVEVVDERTVRLETSGPDALLARYFVQVPILSSEQLAEGEEVWQDQLMGTGPYRLVNWQQGQQVVVEANADYWDDDTQPTWQTVELNAVDEPSTRLAALRSGEAGLVGDVLPEQVAAFEEAGATIVAEPPVNTAYFAFAQRPPLDDPAVRQAFSLAVDRTEIVDTLFAGYAEPASSIVPQEVQGSVPEVFPQEGDPDAALALLEEAGVQTPVRITVDTTEDMAAVAELAAAQVAEAGFELDIEIIPRSAVFDVERMDAAPGPRMLLTTALDSRMFDGRRSFETLLTSNAFVTDYGYVAQEGNDDAFADYLAAEDDDARTAASRELHDAFEENPPGVILYFPQLVYATAEGVCWEPRGLSEIALADIRPC